MDTFSASKSTTLLLTMSATVATSGRKRKIGDRKYQKNVWLNQEEADLLAALADAMGLSEADTLRHGLRFLAANTYLPSEGVISSVPLAVGAKRAKLGRPKKLA